MKMPVFMDDRVWEEFRDQVLQWLGTPYRHLMKTKGRGADCTLFLGQALVDFGILKKLEYYYYPTDWHQSQRDDEFLMDNIVAHFVEFPTSGYCVDLITEVGSEIRGDIIGFKTKGSLSTNHAGLLLDKKTMIHSSPGRGVGISLYSDKWKKERTVLMRVMQRRV